MEDWSGYSTEAAGVARLESKWDPLKLQETAVPPAVVEAGGGVPFPPFLLLTSLSLSFFLSFFVWVLQRNRTSVFVLLLEAEEGKMEK